MTGMDVLMLRLLSAKAVRDEAGVQRRCVAVVQDRSERTNE